MTYENFAVEGVLNYYYHEAQDIHEYVFYESSRRSVDAYINHLDSLIQHAIAIENVQPESRVLYDLRHSGQQPVMYLSARIKELMDKYNHLPPSTSHAAVLHGDRAVMIVLQTISSLLPAQRRTRFQFFRSGQRDDALSWLETTRYTDDTRND